MRYSTTPKQSEHIIYEELTKCFPPHVVHFSSASTPPPWSIANTRAHSHRFVMHLCWHQVHLKKSLPRCLSPSHQDHKRRNLPKQISFLMFLTSCSPSLLPPRIIPNIRTRPRGRVMILRRRQVNLGPLPSMAPLRQHRRSGTLNIVSVSSSKFPSPDDKAKSSGARSSYLSMT